MPSREDSSAFRPRFGRSARARSGAGFRNALLAAVTAAGGQYRRVARSARRNARIAVTRPGAGARRVIVKARFVKMTRSGAKAARLHLRYIEREGVEKDGSKGVLYDREGAVRAETFEERRPGEKVQYRFIVSPEDAAELDLTAYVRRLMARVERDLGQPLEWAAVNHHDTGHPHAHIVLRGADTRGREVRLDRTYISSGLRYRAQELATLELGPRTELEVQRTRAREVDQERLTSLDRELERRAWDNVVDLSMAPERGRGTEPSILLARLHRLETFGLAERTSATSWALGEGWSERLRERGTRGDILKQMHAALRGDLSRYRIVRPGEGIEQTPTEPGTALVGRVASKGLSDELAGRYYAVLETPGGGGYHVPLTARDAETLRPGDLVTFRSERVGPDLDVSSGRERHRIVLRKEPLGLDEQVRHAGPVLLDELAIRPLAPTGFGGDVRRALGRRAEYLRSLGIDPADPDRGSKLPEAQRRELGRDLARSSGQAFLAETPPVFQGRVQLVGRGGDSPAYAVVSDGARFVLVPAGAEIRGREGQIIGLQRDAAGALRVLALGLGWER